MDRREQPEAQRRIGLTGGIGMGKTIVSDHLKISHSLPVLDADVFAREAVAAESPILAAIADRYGGGILFPDGSLNRSRLGGIIFGSVPERLWLEQQIHPFVRERLVSLMATVPNPTIVLVIPLLFEARMTDLITESWVVHCSSKQQLERLMQRDQLTQEQAQARINSQMAIQRKLAYADVVLDNSASIADLLQQVDQALAQPPVPTGIGFDKVNAQG
ncbi:MAG TPA: dephospho-CoA kinase [Thermosynechococcaceae cyanobacterium]